MKLISLMAGSLLLTSVAIAEEAPNATNGQKLFNESRCLECHSVDLFTSINRKVNNLAGLENVVRRCDANLSTNWFDDQILDVVAYLNKAYYKFEKVAQQSGSIDSEAATEKVNKPVIVVNAESE